MPHILGENSVASDEGSAGSLTPTPSKNFKAVLREQVLVLVCICLNTTTFILTHKPPAVHFEAVLCEQVPVHLYVCPNPESYTRNHKLV